MASTVFMGLSNGTVVEEGGGGGCSRRGCVFFVLFPYSQWALDSCWVFLTAVLFLTLPVC